MLREKSPNTEFPLVPISFWSVNLRIQSEYRKIRAKKNPYLDTFHAVVDMLKQSLKIKSQCLCCKYFPGIFKKFKGRLFSRELLRLIMKDKQKLLWIHGEFEKCKVLLLKCRTRLGSTFYVALKSLLLKVARVVNTKLCFMD